MAQKTAHDFDQELLILFDAYVHGGLDRRGFLDKAAKYAVGGVTAAMLLDQLSPKFVEAQVDQARGPADQGAVRRVRLAEWLRQDARLPGPAGQGHWQAAGRPRHPREPWIEPAHRGYRPPAGHSTTSWRSRPTRSSRSAAIREAKTRPARSSRSSIRPRRARTSSPRPPGSRRGRRPTARSARSASATAAGWSTSWRLAYPTSRPALPTTAARPTSTTCPRSRPRS